MRSTRPLVASAPAGIRRDRDQARPLDARLTKAPADRRVRMHRCEVLPRPDPLAGTGSRVWTLRAGAARPQ